METKVIHLCCHSYCGGCHRNNHDHGECQYLESQESCPHFDGNYEYKHNRWIEGISEDAAKLFPYETEETCPNALARTMKNQCIDCVRAGYVRGYVEGHESAIAYA